MQSGRLEAGMVVTQNELCDLLGLSLSPLRETLVLLEEFGLVEIKPRTGIRIVYPEVAFIRENYQFRHHDRDLRAEDLRGDGDSRVAGRDAVATRGVPARTGRGGAVRGGAAAHDRA
ncbi:MAG: GntR family transcriptional regulator [Devosia sp.]|nr:GntR family transcriptional regulator [Devosia sp.]